jgi:hypothetical protein
MIGHRELLLSAARKCRSAFLQLPEKLQDEIIDGLDSGELTYREAEKKIAQAGFDLSYNAIYNLHKTLRRERRLFLLRDNLKELMNFADMDPDKNAKALLNLTLVSAIQGLADGEIGIRDLDLARMMAATGKEITRQDQQDGQDIEENNPGAGGLSEATAEEIRRKILTGK